MFYMLESKFANTIWSNLQIVSDMSLDSRFRNEAMYEHITKELLEIVIMILF